MWRNAIAQKKDKHAAACAVFLDLNVQFFMKHDYALLGVFEREFLFQSKNKLF